MMSFESFVRLGISFFRTVIRRALSRRPELPRFVAQYRPDGMLSAAPDDPTVLAGASRCVACGRCDARAYELGVYESLGGSGPMAFALGATRQPGTDLSIAAHASDETLRALTAACPVGVPFVALAALVRRRHAELAAARLDAPRAPPALPASV